MFQHELKKLYLVSNDLASLPRSTSVSQGDRPFSQEESSQFERRIEHGGEASEEAPLVSARPRGDCRSLVRRLLKTHAGTFTLQLPLRATEKEVQQVQSSPLAVVASPSTITSPEGACLHPQEFAISGANQHGAWKRCQACRTKLEYIPYGPSNPRPAAKKKNNTMVSYVAKAAPLPPKTKKTSGNAPYPGDLEQMMAGQNRMLLEGLTNVMSQAMAPVIQGQQAINQNLMSLNAQLPVAPVLDAAAHEIVSSDEEMVSAMDGQARKQ